MSGLVGARILASHTLSCKDRCDLRVAQCAVVEPHVAEAAAEGADLAVADLERFFD